LIPLKQANLFRQTGERLELHGVRAVFAGEGELGAQVGLEHAVGGEGLHEGAVHLLLGVLLGVRNHGGLWKGAGRYTREGEAVSPAWQPWPL